MAALSLLRLYVSLLSAMCLKATESTHTQNHLKMFDKLSSCMCRFEQWNPHYVKLLCTCFLYAEHVVDVVYIGQLH
jgi:hypothetical protein